jgi:hypothetical protein
VPSNGQDSRRAEMRDRAKNKRVREKPKWVVACSIKAEFSSIF